MIAAAVPDDGDVRVGLAIAQARAAILGVDPLADPLLPAAVHRARAELGAAVEPMATLRRWIGPATGERGTIRYRWPITARHIDRPPRYIGPRDGWLPWRPRDVAAIDEDRDAFEERLLLPLILAETVEWLAELADGDGDVATLAAMLVADSRATLRRDAAAFAAQRHAWGDTWALWSFARHPRVLRLLHPFILGLGETYADAAIATGGTVLGSRFPFYGAALVSASAQLATGLVALGVHPKLTGRLIDWIREHERSGGGFGDGDGPPDVLTTLVAADVLAGLDPAWDPRPSSTFLARRQDGAGWWRAYGPETAWLTDEIRRHLQRAARPFPDRFGWPEVAITDRDRRTGLPRFDYYAALARLFAELPGLAAATVEVAFIDLAGFGAFNNRHGMAMGDAVLRTFAQALARIPGVAAIRDGGDEFLLIRAPSGSGLIERLDGFRRAWPGVLQERFGRDAVVAPRILVGTTHGEALVDARDELGRRIAELKGLHASPGPDGVLYRLRQPI